MENAKFQKAFFRKLAPDGQILQLFDLIPEVAFFIKDLEGRFMALSLNKFEHCGFHDHAHLSRSFRKIMQVTPTKYRAVHRLE